MAYPTMKIIFGALVFQVPCRNFRVWLGDSAAAHVMRPATQAGPLVVGVFDSSLRAKKREIKR